MEYCIDFAIKGQNEVLYLAVWEHNHKAIQFYEKWGFEPFGSHIFVLGTDKQNDILMKKNLSNISKN
jgi:ribosomal protein S18 acetylase RimI-like enzyme